MWMWMMIFAAMFVAMVIGIIYIIGKLSKTGFVAKLTGESKIKSRLLSAAVVLALIAVSYFGLGVINTAIVIVQALIICILIDVIVWIFGKKSSGEISRDAVVLASVLILIAYFGWGWFEAHHIVATRYDLTSEKAVEDLRLVQITDSHLGATFDGEGFAEAVERIQQENPDIVVITGDFVDDDSSKDDMIRSCQALGTLQTKYGVYFVFGNHDKGFSNTGRGYDAEELVRNLEENGVRVLEDETVSIGDTYELIGRQDRSEESLGRSRASMEELVSNLDPDKYQIVLDHQPNDFANQEKAKVDLVLSGHTHGGQFFPINRMGELFGLNDMTYGIRHAGNTTFEVSSGISDWAIKFKTGCKAEYVVIDIKEK